MSTQQQQVLQIARWFVRERGFSVIPIDHPDDTGFPGDPDRMGKVPCLAWKAFQSARASDDNLLSWFGNGHVRNIAIVTGQISNIVVVDGDSPEALTWMHRELPATPMRTKTAKGEHWFYRHPGRPIRNKAKLRTDNGTIAIDVRGDGGYVVAPTAKHATGVIYERLGQWPRVDELPPFNPTWLEPDDADARAPVVRTGPAPVRDSRDRLLSRVRAYLTRTPGAIEGQGGDTHTFQVACRIVRGFQLDSGDARLVLGEWNQKCVPPWSDRELDSKIASALKNGREAFGGRAAEPAPRIPIGTASEPPPHDREPRAVFPLTDTGNAEAFAEWYGDRVRYDHQRKRFYIWAGHRFRLDGDGEVERIARTVVRRRGELASAIDHDETRKKTHGWALSSESRGRLDSMLGLVRSMIPIADKGDTWDLDPWLLGVPNGVVDLRTGLLRPGEQRDRVTLSAGVDFDPDAECPTWERVFSDIFNGDHELEAHVHRAFGYSLTGLTTEQCLWVMHGTGANGKSTVVNAMRVIVGDYGHVMPFGTLLGTGHRMDQTNDIAALQGKRLVVASEANEGARFDEARIKQLTGGDAVTARYLYGEFFQFVPVAKFFLSTNHRPSVRDQTHSFWRRLRLLPFTRTFPTNPGLWDDLLAEAPGILAWAVRGCLLWQAEGLGTPAAMCEATDAYQQDSDPISDFVGECCEVEPDGEVSATDLYRAYVQWADQRRLSERERLSQTMFGRKASDRWKKTRLSTGILYIGVRLRAHLF